MHGRPYLLGMCLFLCLVLPAAGTKTATVEVQLQNFSFNPPSVTITVGDTINWVNKTSTVHTTTSGSGCTSNGIWDGSLPSFNSSFSFEFLSAGDFPYFCRPHCGLGMTGTIVVEEATGITPRSSSALPSLNQNYPNPFNPTTTISFVLPSTDEVNLSIYDAQGALIQTLVEGRRDAGVNTNTWDGRDTRGEEVSSGVYFYRLTAGDKTLTKKMVLLK